MGRDPAARQCVGAAKSPPVRRQVGVLALRSQRNEPARAPGGGREALQDDVAGLVVTSSGIRERDARPGEEVREHLDTELDPRALRPGLRARIRARSALCPALVLTAAD